MSTSQAQNVKAVTPDKPTSASTPSVIVVAGGNGLDGLLNSLQIGQTSEAGDGPPEYVDASDLSRSQWMQLFASSSVLKAWKRTQEGERVHINRAPCAAIALKSPVDPNDEDDLQGLPDFEISDDTYIETRESKSMLEREMTLKAFTESGIKAALDAAAPDVSFGVGGEASWKTEKERSLSTAKSNTTVHGFYNFPRVIVHLYPDNLTLSPQCIAFFKKFGDDCLDERKVVDTVFKFEDGFGAVLPTRVTLGGRLCTSQEAFTDDRSDVARKRKAVQTQLDATVKAAGAGLRLGGSRNKGSDFEANEIEKYQSSSATTETQGGNGLLSSSVADWIQSIGSHKFWRPIQQDQSCDSLAFLSELTDDETLRKSIRVLSLRASRIRQDQFDFAAQVRAQHRKVLEIEASAAMLTNSPGTYIDSQDFNFTITLSDTLPINRMILFARDSKNQTTKELADVPLLVRPRSILGMVTQRACSMDLYDGMRVDENPLPGQKKSNRRFDTALVLELAPSFAFDTPDDVNVPQVRLDWPDLEINPHRKWTLTYRELEIQPQFSKQILDSAGGLAKQTPDPRASNALTEGVTDDAASDTRKKHRYQMWK